MSVWVWSPAAATSVETTPAAMSAAAELATDWGQMAAAAKVRVQQDC